MFRKEVNCNSHNLWDYIVAQTVTILGGGSRGCLPGGGGGGGWKLGVAKGDVQWGRGPEVDTGTGNKRRIINVTELAPSFTQQMCTSLLTLHVYTRCDTTSAFTCKGIGKVPIGVWKAWRAMDRSRRGIEGLRRIHMCYIWSFTIQEHNELRVALFPTCWSTLI